MVLLPSILKDDASKHPLVILQSSLAQSSLPILRSVLAGDFQKGPRSNILICLLYPPATLVDAPSENLEVHDWIDRVPGYNDLDATVELLAITAKALQDHSHPVTIIIDSTDVLLTDRGSLAETYQCLSQIFLLVKQHRDARLILHTQSPSPLLPLITSTSFSASLAHIISHPPALVHHIATEFLIPPPPLTPLPKFWSVFLPVSERIHDTERLVFGPGGQGSGHPSEIVLELIVRESSSGRKRSVNRVLEGWSDAFGKGSYSCELTALESLKNLDKKQTEVVAPDPTQNLSFNLNLTSLQQESRAQVPLPYAHEGKPITSTTPAAIFYDPDSADDIDDDDPDEDLDI